MQSPETNRPDKTSDQTSDQSRGNTPENALADLLAHLDLEDRGGDVYRGHSQRSRNGRIFGGLVFAQAMRAGLATSGGRPPHSAHAYFLRPGDPTVPIDYEVDRIRDGRSFTTRRIVAKQNGTAIFNLALSCHDDEPSTGHQRDVEIPREPSGESHEEGIRRGLRSMGIEVADNDFGFGAFEVLVEDGLDMTTAPARIPELRSWMRARGSVPEDRGLHACLLAYVSDLTIVIPAYHPRDFGPMTPGVQSASLDHAMWFHAPIAIDDWIYSVGDSPILSGSRALGRALFYSRDGRLVASAVQEGLVRRSDV
jgi:acyl-CoA thioesterase-2